MGVISVTVSAEEADLRRFVADPGDAGVGERLRVAVAAALPEPRLHPREGDVVRRGGAVFLTARSAQPDVVHLYPTAFDEPTVIVREQGLDGAEWELLQAADLHASFDLRKEGK